MKKSNLETAIFFFNLVCHAKGRSHLI